MVLTLVVDDQTKGRKSALSLVSVELVIIIITHKRKERQIRGLTVKCKDGLTLDSKCRQGPGLSNLRIRRWYYSVLNACILCLPVEKDKSRQTAYKCL